MADGRIELPEVRPLPRMLTDGRHRRSAHSRQRILDALIALLSDGEMRPSADQLAERAGVGRRTVFRLFSDMESIYAGLYAQMRSDLQRERDANDSGEQQPFDRVLARRCRFLERWLPLHRAAAAFPRDGGPVDRAQRAFAADLRRDLAHALGDDAEPKGLPLLEALDALLSPEVWARLRLDQKLDAGAAQRALSKLTEGV